MNALMLVSAFAAQVAGATDTATPAPAAGANGSSISERTYLDLEGGVGYSTNPFISSSNSSGAGFGRVSAHLVHTRISTRTTTALSAYAQSIFYTHGVNSAQSFDLNARHDAAVTEKLRLFVDADGSYDRGGQLDTRILTVPTVPLIPGTTVPPPLLTTGGDFLNVTGRSYRLIADAGGQYTISPRDFIDFSTGANYSVFKTGNTETRYTSIPVSLGFERAVSERTTLGARVAASWTHYGDLLNNQPRNFHVITPEATAQVKLSPTLSLSADAGASFSTVDEGNGTHHSTGFAGDVALCSAGELTQFCGRASVQEQAPTSAGPARVVSAGVDYSRRFNEYDSLQLSLSADHYSNPVLLVSGLTSTNVTYLRAVANYSRRFGTRLFGGVDLSARKVTENGPHPDADLSASLFIRYRFGDLR